MKKKVKKSGFWEKLAHANISRIDSFQSTEELFQLTEEEKAKLKAIETGTLLRAGIAGALGVIVLYLPLNIFGQQLFPLQIFQLPYINQVISLSIEFLLYSAFLVLLEIWYLTYLNIKAVSAMSAVFGHPNPANEFYEDNLQALIALGIEKKQEKLETIGLNPFNGLSKIWLAIFYVLIKIKAMVSNVLFTFLVKKVLGRYALRLIVEFAGIPVYAFWNMWGAKKVMDETRVRALAPPLIKQFAEALYQEQRNNTEFCQHIYDTLQLISESKRSFHYNHFLLSIMVLNKFSVNVELEPFFERKFVNSIENYSELTRAGIKRLFVFGILIDGKISYREKRILRTLRRQGLILYPESDIIKWANDYYHGKGIEHLIVAGQTS